MQKPMSLTDLIPVINMVMHYINTVILDYLQVLDPDSGIRMCNPASANDSGEWVHWQRRPPYPASALWPKAHVDVGIDSSAKTALSG